MRRAGRHDARARRWPRSSATPRCSVPPDDPTALADAIAPRARRARPAPRACAPPGPVRAAEFTWERCVDQHVDAYRRAVGRREPAHEGAHHGRQRLRRPVPRAHCTSAGDEVVSVDRSGPDSARHHRPRRDPRQSFARHRPEVVYHLAALVARRRVVDRSRPRVLRVNVEGTANVLDAARAADVGRVIVIGSAEEYGRVDERDLPLREDAPLRPSTPYGVSKIAASFLALQAHLAYGLDVVRVRAFTHTGPGQSDRFLIPALAHRIAAAERERPRRDPRRFARPGPRPQRRARRRARVPAPRRRTATRARSTTCAPEPACRCARSPSDLVAAARRPLRLTVDPDARAPGRGARASSATPSTLRAAHRLVTGVLARPRPSPTCSTTPATPRSIGTDGRSYSLSDSGVLVVEPAEQRGDRARVVPQPVRPVGDDPQLDTSPPAASASRRASSTGTTSSALPCTSSHGRGAMRRAASTGSRLAIARIHASGSVG